MSVCWQLLADGLLFIDYTQGAPENWTWRLTERGHRAARADRDYEPDDQVSYMGLLGQRIASLDGVVRTYANEAVNAYAPRCYLASSVMLGVASERAFLMLAEAFADTLEKTEAANLKTILEGSKQKITGKFDDSFAKSGFEFTEYAARSRRIPSGTPKSATFQRIRLSIRLSREGSGAQPGVTHSRIAIRPCSP
jgi:hypothetical protein